MEGIIPSDVLLNTHVCSATQFFCVISLQKPSEVKSHDSHFTNGNLKAGKLDSFDLDQADCLWSQRRFVVKWRGKAGWYNSRAHAQVAGPYCPPGKVLGLVFTSGSFIIQPIILTQQLPLTYTEKTGSEETETF